MKTGRDIRVSSMALASVLMIAACADGRPEDSLASEGDQAAGADLTSRSSAIVVDSTFLEDPTAPGRPATGCNGMHCCPDGYAMQGAHVDGNVFKCRRVRSGVSTNACYVDGPGRATFTMRNNIHTCKFGYYMRGLHRDQNLLTCCTSTFDNNITSEFIDGDNEPPTQYVSPGWGFSAHTCPDHGPSLPSNVWVMSGIDFVHNYFYCAF